jgi:hypothetical protein
MKTSHELCHHHVCNASGRKRGEREKRLESGIREKLVKRAIGKFGIEGKFDVPKQTIFCCIASEQLEVWHPGTESPLLEVEVVLISFLFTAHRLCCPLSVGDTIALMNALISGTSHNHCAEKDSLLLQH